MKKRSSFFLLFIFFSFPLFCGFDLKGRIRLEGKPPATIWLDVPAEHQADCGERKLSPRLKISWEGGVASAAVWLEGNFPSEFPASSNKNHTLDQLRCKFSPHIQLLPKNAPLSIINSDGFLHNVRAFDQKSGMLFNDAMPTKGQVLEKRFGEPGIVVVRCGIHHWMHAIVVVQEHPYYALTDEAGRFKISGIPEGSYTLHVWHETLGELKKEVKPGTPPIELSYRSPNQ